MKIIAKTLLAASLCILMAAPAHAGHYDNDGPLVDRMQRQHQRIESGIESGALTSREAGKLGKKNHKTRVLARKFRKDDVLTLKERRILNKRLNKTSHRIWKFKHNDQERYTGWNASRVTHRDANPHHGHDNHQRHHQHGKHHDDDRHSASCFSDNHSWPLFGFLSQ